MQKIDRDVRFHASGDKRLVLIVDDEAVNRELLAEILRSFYEVLIAESGEEALQIIRERRQALSLVLLDLIMPGMHGTTVLETLRNDPVLCATPVIVMTSDRKAEVESLAMGAADFIPKPYPEPNVILARVRRTIELHEDRSIIQLTERDALTGLYSREYFYRYCEQFDRRHPEQPMDAVVTDINHFRMINERYGKAYADQVLARIGRNLSELVREGGGLACRREADTFLIYWPHRDDYAGVLERASRDLVRDEAGDNRVRLRIGVYSGVDKAIDIERRFDRAKMASDSVRSSFTKQIAWYDQALHDTEIFAEQLIEDFPRAIAEGQFQVYYQPKFDVRPETPRLNSAEALVRWKHPVHGMISPGTFIPLFEKNGLILDLDSYVWRETARQMRDWKDRLGFAVPVSVNVSRVDLYDPNLVGQFQNLLSEFDLTSDEFLLEITESAYTEQSDQIIDAVGQLRALGFHIEMDDFGTGYSSLNMISTLPIDALKLDMSFIRTAFAKKIDTRILEVIIEIADSLTVPVIAEGVESMDQLRALKHMGCDIVQGFFFSRPVPASDFEAFLTEERDRAKDAERSAPAPEAPGEAACATGEQGENEHTEPAAFEDEPVPQSDVRSVPLRTVSAAFMIIAFILAAALYFVDNAVTDGYRSMEQASRNFILAEQAASSLAMGSDYLTDSVRCFVVTEDIEYLNRFFEEVDVTRRRDRAVEDLEALLKGSDSAAYGYLSDALALSNELIGYENRAMRLIVEAGAYDQGLIPQVVMDTELTEEELRLAPVDKQRLAIELVFGETYASYKQRIRSNTDLCTEDLIAASEKNLEATARRMDVMLHIQTLLTISMLAAVFLMVLFINRYVRKPLTRMVEMMKDKRMVPLAGARELRFVTNTYNEIFHENREARRRLTYEAMHDALTGLYNRNGYEILRQSVDLSHVALLVVDVDEFKQVNDTYGHEMGDRVLIRVAEVLKRSFRSVDMVFRLGGDEFVVIMTRANSSMRELVLAKVDQVNAMLQNPKDDLPPTSLSVGVAFSDRKNPKGDLFNDADAALYQVKTTGRCGCAIYE